MKKLRIITITLLIILASVQFAFADVAGPFGLSFGAFMILCYALVFACIILAVVLLIKAVGRIRRMKDDFDELKK